MYSSNKKENTQIQAKATYLLFQMSRRYREPVIRPEEKKNPFDLNKSK